MDTFYLALMGIYGFLVLLMAPVYISAFLLRREQPAKALFWCKIVYAVSRLLPTWRGVANNYMAACYIMLGDYATALPYAEVAVAKYRETPDRFKIHRASALAYLGIALSRTGDTARAVTVLEEALSLGPFRKPVWQNMVRYSAASAYIQRGRFHEAMVLCNEILAEPKSNTDYTMLAQAMLSLSCYYQEDFAGALEWSRKALKQKARAKQITPLVQINVLYDLIEVGDLTAAQEMEMQIAPQVAEMTPALQSGAWRGSANLALRLGNLDRARDLAERAAAIDSSPNGLAHALLIQAEVFAARQNAQRALSLTEAILQSEAIDFFKRRALALRERVQASTLHAALPYLTATEPEAVQAVQQVRGGNSSAT